jgi:hypothetical protein
MARQLRLEYPGAIYHILNRGDRREAIFRDDVDHQLFLGTLDAALSAASGAEVGILTSRNDALLGAEDPRAIAGPAGSPLRRGPPDPSRCPWTPLLCQWCAAQWPPPAARARRWRECSCCQRACNRHVQ